MQLDFYVLFFTVAFANAHFLVNAFDCPKKCQNKWEPVCAKRIDTPETRTFTNLCVLHMTKCLGDNWNFIYDGQCYSEVRCPVKTCETHTDPVCGRNSITKKKKTFLNKCYYYKKACEEKWDFRYNGYCFGKVNCPVSNCHTRHEPVCAKRKYSPETRTFHNSCFFYQAKCDEEWELVKSAACSEIVTCPILSCNYTWDPVCGKSLEKNTNSSFINVCLFNKESCTTKMELVHHGFCDNRGRCPMIGECHNRLEPVCARLKFSEEFRTFRNKCLFYVAQCVSDWIFIKHSACHSSFEA